MFKVSKSASVHLKHSMAQHDFDDMPLRVAAQRNADGSIDYQMGFDEAGPGDMMFASSGIDVVIAKDHLALLNGTELDYVEMDDGQKHFIFLNPNDAFFVEPNRTENDNADGKSAAMGKISDKTETLESPEQPQAGTHWYDPDAL